MNEVDSTRTLYEEHTVDCKDEHTVNVDTVGTEECIWTMYEEHTVEYENDELDMSGGYDHTVNGKDCIGTLYEE